MSVNNRTPETTAALLRDICDLLADTEGQREVIAAVLHSVFSAMSKVPQADRERLQQLIAAFIADFEDRPTIEALGAMLRDAKAADH